MTQPSLLDALAAEPEIRPVSAPSGVGWVPANPLPVASSASPQARHASATGAARAALTRGSLTLRYLDLLERLGAVSDHEASGMLGVGLSSINSTRAKLGRHRVVAAPKEFDDLHHWPVGPPTRRTRWRLAPVQVREGLA